MYPSLGGKGKAVYNLGGTNKKKKSQGFWANVNGEKGSMLVVVSPLLFESLAKEKKEQIKGCKGEGAATGFPCERAYVRVQAESGLLECVRGSCSNGQWVAESITTRPDRPSVPCNEIHKKSGDCMVCVFVCVYVG